MQPFGHNRNGPKIGEGSSAPFFGKVERGLHLTQSRLAPYQVASWSMQPLGRNRYGPKIRWGLCPFGGEGAESPSNTMWPGPSPTCMPSFIFICPTVWPQCTNATDRQDRQTDRQWTDSIGRTILQAVAQKRHHISGQKCKYCNFCACIVPSPPPHHNRLVSLFRGPPGWAGARRELLDFMVQGKSNRGTPTIRLGATPSALNSAQLYHLPMHSSKVEKETWEIVS